MEHFEAFQEVCILHEARLEHKEGATAALLVDARMFVEYPHSEENARPRASSIPSI